MIDGPPPTASSAIPVAPTTALSRPGPLAPDAEVVLDLEGRGEYRGTIVNVDQTRGVTIYVPAHDRRRFVRKIETETVPPPRRKRRGVDVAAAEPVVEPAGEPVPGRTIFVPWRYVRTITLEDR